MAKRRRSLLGTRAVPGGPSSADPDDAGASSAEGDDPSGASSADADDPSGASSADADASAGASSADADASAGASSADADDGGVAEETPAEAAEPAPPPVAEPVAGPPEPVAAAPEPVAAPPEPAAPEPLSAETAPPVAEEVPYSEAPTTLMPVSDPREAAAEHVEVAEIAYIGTGRREPEADAQDRAWEGSRFGARAAAPSEPPAPEPAAPPAQPSFQPLSGYQSPGGMDAPVAQDLFGEGGYDDFDGSGPPTEEMPAGVMEDVGQPYNTPYSVPEPPPIPGILDRFTPGPTQRTELGARKRKPDYLADSPQPADRYEPTPAPARKRASRPVDDDDDAVVETRGGAPIGLAVIVLGLGLGAVGLGALVLGLAMILGNGGGGDGGIDPIGRDVTSGGVEVRDNMQKKPGLIGVDEGADGGLPPLPAPAAEPVPEPLPAPAPAPQPSKAAPAPAPAPKPTPKPAPAAPAPSAAKATLKIRSNRRVLVYVNGQAIGYTPQDYKVAPSGTFTVSAMVPGQPNTKQTRDATVTGGGTTVPVDFTF